MGFLFFLIGFAIIFVISVFIVAIVAPESLRKHQQELDTPPPWVMDDLSDDW